jgi:hypothetical protein
MNKEAAYVQDEESAKPKHDQNNSQDEKHQETCFLVRRLVALTRERLKKLRVLIQGIRCLPPRRRAHK